jgi:hypothetical protein
MVEAGASETAMGPWNGISETLNAIEEPIIAAISGEQSGSALKTKKCMLLVKYQEDSKKEKVALVMKQR